jgi:formiminoglutamate deiminase
MHNVCITADDLGAISAVVPNTAARPGDTVLRGIVMPGFANAHSHAFHRALRGRTQGHGGDFWSWRDHMYSVAAVLDPELYQRLAAAVYREMLLCGYTSVGEFHYLHHDPAGVAYASPAMEEAILNAATESGIRLTLLDTCYLRGGFDSELTPNQLRFSDGSVEKWAARVELLRQQQSSSSKIGVAAHSIRALDASEIAEIALIAEEWNCVRHVHASEIVDEVHAAVDHVGRTPIELLADTGFLADNATIVHGTHPMGHDIDLVGWAGATVCVCRTTERDLGDGVTPAHSYVEAGAHLSIGSDSHAVIDPFEETRAIELDQRPMVNKRGLHDPAQLMHDATLNGLRSLGWASDGLVVGSPADFIAVDVDNHRVGGQRDLASVAFAAVASDVHHVVVGGENRVSNRQLVGGLNGPVDVGSDIASVIAEIWKRVG